MNECVNSRGSPNTPSLRSPHELSSVQGGIYALGKAHMRSTPSLRNVPSVAFETMIPTVGGPRWHFLTAVVLSRPESFLSARKIAKLSANSSFYASPNPGDRDGVMMSLGTLLSPASRVSNSSVNTSDLPETQ